MVNKYTFTIIATGLDPNAHDFEDRFFEAGCDDATVAFHRGMIILEFDRRAKRLVHALVSAFADVRKAGARIVRIEPDPLVSISEIAARASVTRAAVSLWSHGKRSDEFPPPVARFTSESPLWDWTDVARWLYRNRRLDARSAVEARILQSVNQFVGETIQQPDEISAGMILVARKERRRATA